MRQKWIYQIRGLAIIAVVICHQQDILHNTEVLQGFTLYSVTTLVFLMGMTKALSIKKHLGAGGQFDRIFVYSLKSMLPVLSSYIVATFIYSYRNLGGGINYNTVLANILDFSASSPFYFIEYYIMLTLWAPLLYSAIKYLIYKDIQKKYKVLLGIILYVCIWGTGYWSIGRMNVFGQSYFFVYSVGLFAGQMELPRAKRIYFVPAFIILMFGTVSMARFYGARVAGVYDYAEGLNFLTPKLQMNPPNIPILLYSFGVIAVAYIFFEMCNQSRFSWIKTIGYPFMVLGKYSMDIFLWHLYIQGTLNVYFRAMEKGILKWLVYYGSMFAFPIVVRCLYNEVKKKIYCILKA